METQVVMKDYGQQHPQQQGNYQTMMPLHTVNYDSNINIQPECLSPASSTTSSMSSSSSNKSSMSPTKNIFPDLSDEELAQLSVRQLNLKLQGHDRKVVSALKQKRRTLKNRGYALNCRVRRLQNQLQLESENIMLREQVRHLTDAVNHLQNRLNYYEPCPNTIITPTYVQQLPVTSSSSPQIPQDTNYMRPNRAY